jgi:hypothetical protein
MNISKSQKTMRVLYLYLTIPLLIITMVLGALALMSATSKKSPEISKPAESGSAAADVPTNRLHRPSVEVVPPESKKEEPSSNAAGQAAIIAAITTGLTGLMGAIMQTIVAFLKRKEKREKESDET